VKALILTIAIKEQAFIIYFFPVVYKAKEINEKFFSVEFDKFS